MVSLLEQSFAISGIPIGYESSAPPYVVVTILCSVLTCLAILWVMDERFVFNLFIWQNIKLLSCNRHKGLCQVDFMFCLVAIKCLLMRFLIVINLNIILFII